MLFLQAEDGIRYLVRSRGLGDVYKRQVLPGIDPNQMEAGAESNTGILGLIDAFSGGAFNLSLIHI